MEYQCADIDSGEIRIPRRQTVSHAWHKLDNLSVLWERLEDSSGTSVRVLTADSSLKLWNYLCVRESRFDAPAAISCSPVAWEINQFQKLYRSCSRDGRLIGRLAHSTCVEF